MTGRRFQRRVGPLIVRQYDPGTGWTLAEARALVEQGYTVDNVEERTGWPRQMLTAPRRSPGQPR